MRESPALKIIELLRARGGEISYHDPHVPELAEHGLRSLGLDEALEGIDLAVIVTTHPGVDHGRIVERAPLVLDLRGTTRHLGVPQL
jgi:UDP-N-acetyl-D-mannosaminuronate dehydrogenase